jgi:membrane fusion protein (multidrug efflux system)
MNKNLVKTSPALAGILALLALSLPGCKKHEEAHVEEPHKIVATTPIAKDVTITQPYVCQIHSQRHIELRALESGYLEEIPVKEGQAVKKGELLFQVLPTVYQARYDAAVAEAHVAKLELSYSEELAGKKIVAPTAVALLKAKLAKAEAEVETAKAELDFMSVEAPFDGIIDRLYEQQGSLVDEGARLTTLSDNSVMWVYFNVPEARYLEYKKTLEEHQAELQIVLRLADGSHFDHMGKITAVEADFNNETGNIAFRADFPNPERLLRHGQTGTVLINRVLKDAIVIPQRAVFEILDKRYVYVVDKENVAHQRQIVTDKELDDIYVIKEGLVASDTIVLEGTRQVRDGDKVECEHQAPEVVLANLKYHAE